MPFLCPLNRWGIWSTRRVINVPKVTQPVSGTARSHCAWISFLNSSAILPHTITMEDSVQKQTQFLLVCSFMALSEQSAFVIFSHPGMCGDYSLSVTYPPVGSSVDTDWVSSGSTQFWYSLPGDSVRFHRLRAQSHILPLFQMLIASSTVVLCS
jgi:hypothetical protein